MGQLSLAEFNGSPARWEGAVRHSQVIEVDGVFAGAAIREGDGWRFVAVDHRADKLNGNVFPSLEAIRHHCRLALLIGPITKAA